MKSGSGPLMMRSEYVGTESSNPATVIHLAPQRSEACHLE